MKKVLISENKEQAEQHLDWLKKTAAGITELIAEYNNLPILNNIETREQVKEFLDSPKEYLDHAILTETGISFSKKAQPLPDQIASLYGINYTKIMQKIGGTGRNGLEQLRYDEETKSVVLDPDCKKAVYDSFKEFATSEEEVQAIVRIRKLCGLLNEHCSYFGIASSDMNLIADRAGLKCEIIPGSKQNDPGSHWKFVENITFLRAKLDYEKIHAIS